MGWLRIAGVSAVVLVGLISFGGCQSDSTDRVSLISCRAGGDAAGQDPVIIFIGARPDLGKWARMPDVTDEFRKHGYNAVYLDPWKHSNNEELAASWIRHAKARLGRRVMVVGWSQGAAIGLKAMEIVEREGIAVDTFIELDCFRLNRHVGGDVKPRNVDRVIVIHSRANTLAKGYPNPIVYTVDDGGGLIPAHLALPSHPRTIGMIISEANRLQGAGNVQLSSSSAAPTSRNDMASAPPNLVPQFVPR